MGWHWMANAEHCQLLIEAANQELKQQGEGRARWNNWRIANPEVIPDLSSFFCPATSQGSRIHLVGSGVKLVGFDFSRANLSNSWFSMPDFEGANFSQADLTNAILCWGNLSRVNLQGANLEKVNLNEADLAGADLSNANLKKAELAKANFRGAILWGADLEEAILSDAIFCRPINAVIADPKLAESYNKATLRGAKFNGAKLRGANLSGADLIEADFSEAFLIEADLKDADLSEAKFIKTTLCGADLRSALLIRTDLSEANLGGAKVSAAQFIGANLLKADLTMTVAVATRFKQAILTGACIEDWNISNHTILDDVICDYVYLKQCQKERRPHNGSFAPGEFTKLFTKARETVDLIFLNGIDWQAFLISFQQLQVEAGNKTLSIQAIENKNDGAFVIRVIVPPELDKSQVELYFKRKYQLAIEAKDKQYRNYLHERIKDKDDLIAGHREQIASIRQNNTELIEIIKIMAEKENSKTENTFNISGSLGSVANQGYIASSGNQNNIGNTAGEAKAEQKSIQHIYNYAPEQKQTLAKAAEEIQKLLQQLEQTNPSATEAQQIELLNDETTPKFKRRVVGALQATGEAAIDEFVLESKYLKVAKAAIKGWIKPE